MFTEEKQSEGFTHVFGTPEIRGLIVDHLMGGNEDLRNLFMTCQFSARMLQSEWVCNFLFGLPFPFPPNP
jgi:hypothetical protein